MGCLNAVISAKLKQDWNRGKMQEMQFFRHQALSLSFSNEETLLRQKLRLSENARSGIIAQLTWNSIQLRKIPISYCLVPYRDGKTLHTMNLFENENIDLQHFQIRHKKMQRKTLAHFTNEPDCKRSSPIGVQIIFSIWKSKEVRFRVSLWHHLAKGCSFTLLPGNENPKMCTWHITANVKFGKCPCTSQ